MSDSESSDPDDDRVDGLAEEFLRAYRDGESPVIEEFLERAPDLRPRLLSRLVRLEIELRQEADETLSLDEYRNRFPDAGEIIDELAGDLRPAKISSNPTSSSNGRPSNEATNNGYPMDFGDYRLIRKIGEGGMGVVYEAEQKSLGNRRLAIKTIRVTHGMGENALKRFRNEVQAVAQLEHRHIVPVFHLGEESGTHFFAMKYIDGQNLSELIRSLRTAVNAKGDSTRVASSTDKQALDLEFSTYRSGMSKGDTLASRDVLEKISQSGSTGHPEFVRQFARMGIQIATALHHVHQNGVVHRDIKPANLLLDSEGDVWLSDFGLAMIRDNPSLTQPGGLIGTYHYMSPEQAMGSNRVIVDHRSDIFSLGVTLYELLTLRRAFPGSSRAEILRNVEFENPPPVRKLSPRVPVDLDTIVMKAMAKDPNARFQSAAEMAHELQRFQAGKPLTIRPPSNVERFLYWARSNRQTVNAIAVSLSAIFLAAIFTAVFGLNARATTQLALDETKKQLSTSEGLRLAARSLLVSKKDETLALLLAIEAAARHKASNINDALTRALDVGYAAFVFEGHSVRAGHLAFSSDSRRLISSSHAADFGKHIEPAIIWDTQDGAKLAELQYESAITSSVFGPNDNRILTASSPPRQAASNDIDESNLGAPPVLWKRGSGGYGRETVFENAFLFRADPTAFSPDGARIVLPTRGNTATVYRCDGGAVLVRLVGHDERVVFAGFHPTKNQVLTVSDDQTLRIWDAATGKVILSSDDWIASEQPPTRAKIRWAKFSPNGQILVTDRVGPGIQMWDLTKEGAQINKTMILSGNAEFLADGDLLLTHGMPGFDAVIRHVYDGVIYDEIDLRETLPMKILVSPDNQVAAIRHLGDLTSLLIWDLKRHAMRVSLSSEAIIDNIAISPDSRFVAACSVDKRVRLWFAKNGAERATFATKPQPGLPVVASSPDGSSLAITTNQLVQGGALCRFDRAPQTLMLDGKVTLPPIGGERMLVSRGNRVDVYDSRDGRFLELRTEFWDRVRLSAINRQGDRAAVSLDDDTVVLWMLGENPRRVALHIGSTMARKLGFTNDGKKLLAATENGQFFVWDAETGEPDDPVVLGGQLSEFDGSPDGSNIAIVSLEHVITLLDAQSLETTHQFREPGTYFDRVKFSADGRYLLAFGAASGDAIHCYDVESRELSASLNNDSGVLLDVHPTQPEALVWSRTGAFIWRYETDERIAVTDQSTAAGAYARDGETFYLASRVPDSPAANGIGNWPAIVEQPTVQQWSREGVVAGEKIPFSLGSIHRLQTRDEGQVFVNTIRRSHVVLHEAESGGTTASIAGHYAPITHTFFSADSRRLITTSWDGRVSIWDASTGALQSSRNDHGTPILAAAMSRDRRFLVTGGRDGTCRVWNLINGTVSESIAVAQSAMKHVCFDPDANAFLAISSDGKLNVFERESLQRVELDAINRSIAWAEFSPDGESLLIIPSEEGEASTSVVIIPLDGADANEYAFRSNAVLTSHFHPDGKKIVTATRDVFVYITNLQTGKIETALEHPDEKVFSATFDDAGDFVYVSGRDVGTIWRVSDRRRWMTVEEAPIGAYQHTWNPFLPGKPRQFMTRRSDNRLYRVWPLDPESAAKKRVTRDLTEPEIKRYLLPYATADDGSL